MSGSQSALARMWPAFLVVALASLPAPAETERTIEVPVRVHVVSDLEMRKDGLRLASRVTLDDVQKTVMPEVNRIWRSAGIAFVVEEVAVRPSLAPPERDQLIRTIVEAHRDDRGKADPERIDALAKLVDFDTGHTSGIDVFLVPYLGETSQGHAKRRRRRVLVAEWSDKATKARQPPERLPLTEPRPLEKGSVARTLAHELGHVLDLDHPEKSTQVVFDRLMGGKRPGYELTRDEVAIARRAAEALAVAPELPRRASGAGE